MSTRSIDHSPLPWRTRPGAPRWIYPAGDSAALQIASHNDDDQTIADAHFICRAVNAHASLVCELKIAIFWLEELRFNLTIGGEAFDRVEVLIERSYETLRQATGTEHKLDWDNPLVRNGMKSK